MADKFIHILIDGTQKYPFCRLQLECYYKTLGHQCNKKHYDPSASIDVIYLFVQVEILKENGNKLVLHCSAGYDNSPSEELKAAGDNFTLNARLDCGGVACSAYASCRKGDWFESRP